MRIALLPMMSMTVLLTGCAAVDRPDSPKPSLPGVDVCMPDAGKLPRPVASGARCLVQVRAIDWITPVPVAVKPGEVYRISVSEDQLWYDSTRPSRPLVGDEGNTVMKWLWRMKRHPDAKWFALFAAVLPAGKGSTIVAPHDLTKSVLVRIPASGQLVFYPNDAATRLFGRRIFYRNNRGAIWALVERCDESCLAAPR